MNDPVRILIVEEQDTFRQALRAQLENAAGLTVVGEMIERIGTLAPDVVLLSLNAQSDTSIVTRISERYPHVKLLVLGAGSDQAGLALDAFRQGAQGYLDRDANPLAEIVEAVRTLSRGGAVLDPGMAGWILNEIVYMQRQNVTEEKEGCQEKSEKR